MDLTRDRRRHVGEVEVSTQLQVRAVVGQSRNKRKPVAGTTFATPQVALKRDKREAISWKTGAVRPTGAAPHPSFPPVNRQLPLNIER
jgi:hypothetical protein